VDAKLKETLESVVSRLMSGEYEELEYDVFALNGFYGKLVEGQDYRTLARIKEVLSLVANHQEDVDPRSYYMGKLKSYIDLTGALNKNYEMRIAHEKLTETEKKILLYVASHKDTTNTDITESFQYNKNNTSNHLTKLLHKNMVRVFQTGRNRYYSLTASGREWVIKERRKRQEKSAEGQSRASMYSSLIRKSVELVPKYEENEFLSDVLQNLANNRSKADLLSITQAPHIAKGEDSSGTSARALADKSMV
jgi:DNA-binding MarR family transcriptional regulator